MVPFYNLSFEIIFNCKPPEEQMEGMFHLIDVDCNSVLGFPEFILFIAVVCILLRVISESSNLLANSKFISTLYFCNNQLKQIEAECDADPVLGRRMFVGMDSKFQRFDGESTIGEETKESAASELEIIEPNRMLSPKKVPEMLASSQPAISLHEPLDAT